MNRTSLGFSLISILASCASAPTPQPAPVAVAQPAPKAYAAVPLDLFERGTHLFRAGKRGGYPKYKPEQIVEIAENLLLMQRTDGSWAADHDPTCIFTDAERAKFEADKAPARTSFDNQNVFPQVEYLAAVYTQTRDERYREASVRGLGFILAKQHVKCGGWPHTVPPALPHHGHTTLADHVTTGNLSVLRKIAMATEPFAFADVATRQRAAEALERGDACLLRLQIVQHGQLAGWAGQYDPETLAPTLGRKYELPAIAAWETVTVVRYLMSIPQPGPGVRRAVDAAVAWLERSILRGLRYETFDAPLEIHGEHKLKTDRRLVDDPKAPPLWARFYDLDDNSVVLASSDGKRRATFSDVPRERRAGYGWYGDWAEKLLSQEYPAWKARQM